MEKGKLKEEHAKPSFERIKIRDLIELVVIPIFGYCAYTINDLSKNVAALNTNVAVILAQTIAEKERVNGIDRRLEKIEDKIKQYR